LNTDPADSNPKDPDAKVRKWLKVIDTYDREFKAWTERCEKLIKIYTETRRVDGSNVRRMSLLWANISVLQPAIYAKSPSPSVSRRFKDDDPVARHAAEIVERCVDYTFDDTDFDYVMRLCRDDYLLVGRGTSWIRYDAEFSALNGDDGKPLNRRGQPLKPESERDESDPDESPGEELEGEHVCIDHVGWRDFGHNAARSWREVTTVWRKVYMTRDEGASRFGNAKFDNIELDHKAGEEGTQDSGGEAKGPSKATVYEIWDKPSRKVIFVAKGGKEVLEEVDPYLKLKDFFPCPKPLYGTLQTASLKPVPDYVFYQDQVEEVDDLTARIGALVDQLKVVGLYPASATDASEAIQQIAMSGVENRLIPVPNWNQFKEGGGVGGMIEWWPVDQVIKVIEGCFQTRKQLIDDIYQITGISDIMRGEGDKNETATAQNIKNQWGSVRVRDRQNAMAYFARDVSRIVAEVICDKFQPKTLMEMSNITLPTDIEVQQAILQAQVQAQKAAQAAQIQAQQQAQLQPPPQQPQLMPPSGHA
jgi:hypothetical protein